MNKDYSIILGPELQELIHLLKSETLNPVKTETLITNIPHSEIGSDFKGHVRILGSFLAEQNVAFEVHVKRGSNTEKLIKELIKYNINSFEYQMAVGDLVFKQEIA